MKNYGGQERRQFPRLAVNYVLSYRLGEAKSYYDFTQTKNVSQGGLNFASDKVFDKGTQICLSMRWPFSPKRIEIKGEVIESQKLSAVYSLCETRIKFLDLSQEESLKIGEFIQERIGR